MKTKLLILTSVLTLSSISLPVFAGKPSGGKCLRDQNETLSSVKVTIESSRRIRAVTTPGVFLGETMYPVRVDYYNKDGVHVGTAYRQKNSPDLADVAFEGLNQGESYTIRAVSQTSVSGCHRFSPIVSFTMPLDLPETNAPIVQKLESMSYWYAPKIKIYSSDDTAIESYKVFINGKLDGSQIITYGRTWSNVQGSYDYGSKFEYLVSDPALAGKAADVTIEVTDIFGNVKQHSQQLLLAPLATN